MRTLAFCGKQCVHIFSYAVNYVLTLLYMVNNVSTHGKQCVHTLLYNGEQCVYTLPYSGKQCVHTFTMHMMKFKVYYTRDILM